VSSQLQEPASSLNLFQVDGELGQPRLRQSCEQLYVMLDRGSHLLILLVLRGSTEDVISQIRQLKLPVENLLADALDELEQMLDSAGLSVELDAFVLLPDVESSESEALRKLLPSGQTVFSEAIAEFPKSCVNIEEPLTGKNYDRLSSLLFPKREWKRVQLVRDEGRMARQEVRVELDKQLVQFGWGFNAATTIIDGGPGTGKSLLLSSRARWLAEALPDAKIALVTWNKSLAEALENWLTEIGADVSRVHVLSFAELLKRQNIELNLADPADADLRCRQLLQREKFTATFDAILVDEAQDLGGVLLELLQRLLKPNRGGLTIAMDSSQNVRNRPLIDRSKLSAPVETIRLTQCHRSTFCIRSFCQRLEGSNALPEPNAKNAMEEPVRLVWAESPEQCTAMIVSETRRLITDIGLQPHECMVVAFDGEQRRQLAKTFQEQGQQTSSPGRLETKGEGIRIATPENAKGHEASCVFVVGWDSKDGGQEPHVRAARRYVAASRACDILYVVYTSQDAAMIPGDSDSGVLKQLWPDDFETSLQRQD